MQVKCDGVSNNTNNNLHQFDSDSVPKYLTISSGTKLQEMKETFFLNASKKSLQDTINRT